MRPRVATPIDHAQSSGDVRQAVACDCQRDMELRRGHNRRGPRIVLLDACVERDRYMWQSTRGLRRHKQVLVQFAVHCEANVFDAQNLIAVGFAAQFGPNEPDPNPVSGQSPTQFSKRGLDVAQLQHSAARKVYANDVSILKSQPCKLKRLQNREWHAQSSSESEKVARDRFAVLDVVCPAAAYVVNVKAKIGEPRQFQALLFDVACEAGRHPRGDAGVAAPLRSQTHFARTCCLKAPTLTPQHSDARALVPATCAIGSDAGDEPEKAAKCSGVSAPLASIGNASACCRAVPTTQPRWAP
mmetsp:Transcript_101903/g.287562  ORF Transcript_101903/g.287562 Transcript_101903/m.287562 type:complete len:300 (+) Transcript_101903:424-1323(+)